MAVELRDLISVSGAYALGVSGLVQGAEQGDHLSKVFK